MSDLKCARMLLRAAERDVQALRVTRRSDEVSDEVFGFHVQQAAEKALKARIALLGDTYPLTHNIEDLLDFLVERGVNMSPFETLVGYTPYAVEFRYHGVDADVELIERDGAVALVEALLESVQNILASEEAK